ncbi:protein COFACTOR ASSEMBLY OF COMPLEX C SUBUNIT B CCB4, chloroplastic isoform X2 [Typha latifolia]|uniref:protein COFACTOR ASSEMBLY OF COMPLEX C SUBUNIT B CCB4, chloroplastic isoform X2 n=1 Tax=Typha latifolia TaxID=4733 RepID=UPI003C2D40DD
MEAGGLLRVKPFSSLPLTPYFHRRLTPLPCSFAVKGFSSSSPAPPSASSRGMYRGPKPRRDLVEEWVSGNDGLVRSLPIFAGGVSLLAVLVNRAFSGIAPVADASRAWKSLSAATCCKSLVVMHGGDCLLQIGIAAESPKEDGEAVDVDAHKLIQGSLYKSVMEAGKQSYLANLSLYPGRSELPFLPTNTQALILQPVGDRGIAIVGGDTVRGFTNLDQAWINSIAEKLDATLSKS